MYIAIALIDIVQMLLWVLSMLIIVQAVMSWLVAFNILNRSSDFVRAIWAALERLTEPLYRPIRRLLPDFGGIDFTPLVVLLIIWMLDRLLEGLQQSLYYGA